MHPLPGNIQSTELPATTVKGVNLYIMITNNVSRRKFLKASGISGTAFLLGFYFPAKAGGVEFLTGDEAETSNIELKAWILINTAGKVTLVSHRAEMGQGVYQSIAQIIAEELEVDLKDVDIIFGAWRQRKIWQTRLLAVVQLFVVPIKIYST